MTATTKDIKVIADALWKATQKVRAMEAKLRPLKDAANAIEEQLLDELVLAKLESVATKNVTISVKRTQFVELYDDRTFFEHVRKRNEFDLVRKQPVLKACQARWEDNVEVPGCRPGTKIDLSITARKK